MPDPLLACEREEIRVGLSEDPAVSWAVLGRRIGRHRSTVEREVTRNGGRQAYRAAAAQCRADECRARPRIPKLQADPVLGQRVTGWLRQGYSPAGIAAMLDQTDGAGVCAETIYQGVYGDALDIAGRDCLRSRRPRRRQRRDRDSGPDTHVLGEFTPISARPTRIAERVQLGHWEGDLIIGARNRSAAVTLAERVTRVSKMLALPDGYRAPAVMDALDAWTSTMPRNELISLTWDRGSEMAEWLQLKIAWGVDVYFCDPHAPWQRGLNEHTNRTLRWWFPKGTDLSIHTQKDFDTVTDIVNTTPRRILDWHTPNQRYHHLTAH